MNATATPDLSRVISADTVQAFSALAATTATMGAQIATAWTAYLHTMADDLAAGRTPDGLPEVGTSAAGKRLAMTATVMASSGNATGGAIWQLYTAAMNADETTTEATALARVELCAGPDAIEATWPAITTVVDPTAGSEPRGLAEPAASNAPPHLAEFPTSTREGT